MSIIKSAVESGLAIRIRFHLSLEIVACSHPGYGSSVRLARIEYVTLGFDALVSGFATIHTR